MNCAAAAIMPPCSINFVGGDGMLFAALNDHVHVSWYRQQVERSRALVYDACDRLGCTTGAATRTSCWWREKNSATRLWMRSPERKIFVRDRSTQTGLRGLFASRPAWSRDTQRRLITLEGLLTRPGVISPNLPETQIDWKLGIEGKGRYQISTWASASSMTCWGWLRGMARST